MSCTGLRYASGVSLRLSQDNRRNETGFQPEPQKADRASDVDRLTEVV